MKTGPKGASKPLKANEVEKVKAVVRNDPRDYALFLMGTRTAFRSSDILSLNVGDVRNQGELRVREKKTGKYRQTPIVPELRKALDVLCIGRKDSDPLFVGEKRGTRLTVCTLSRLWKHWCEAAGVGHKGGAHVGRKTWSRLNYERGARIEVISRALNHSSPAVTFAYIMVTDEELKELYV